MYHTASKLVILLVKQYWTPHVKYTLLNFDIELAIVCMYISWAYFFTCRWVCATKLT